jgi:orotidine-5'-phosphate decarboxylase
MAEVIIALDVPGADEARALLGRIGDLGDFYKVGLELYTRAGPDFVQELHRAGKRVFLDLKLHDIPNTVASAVRAAADLDVDLLTIHAAGGPAMLQAAADAASGTGLRLLAVTVLTSLDADALSEVWGRPAPDVSAEVRRLTGMVRDAGVDGVVCSAGEAPRVRTDHGRDFLVVTPGIRPTGTDVGDQRRVATPAEAARAGADYLVLGRAVTRAEKPGAALASVLAEVAAAAV